jgi:carbon-monoxide dehydrogenase large subunit
VDTHTDAHHHGNRVEDLRLITGRGKYASDGNANGQLLRKLRGEEHPTASKVSPLGVKGMGESGCTASIPSLVNAVIDALRPLGIEHLDMPLTPARLWTAIQQASRRKH